MIYIDSEINHLKMLFDIHIQGNDSINIKRQT